MIRGSQNICEFRDFRCIRECFLAKFFLKFNNNNNNNNKLYSVHIPTYIQVADVGMIQLGHMAAH